MSASTEAVEIERNVSKAGGLLRSLVPRAQSFRYYDTSAACLWNGDNTEDHEVDTLVAAMPREVITGLANGEAALQRSLASGRKVIAIPVPGDSGEVTGLLVTVFSRNESKSGAFNPSLIQSILVPALALIGECLGHSSIIAALESSVQDAEKELEFIYAVDEKIYGGSRRHSSLAQLVGRSGRFVGINYTVLLIPSKRIRISATHSGWKDVDRKAVDRYLVDQLMPGMDGQRKPIIARISGEFTPGEAGTEVQALLCPLLDQQDNVEGLIAQIGKVNNTDFTRNDRRFMAYVSRKIEFVIEKSFDAMTGLMNRAGFEEQLHESFRALRSDQDAHQIIYFDLDNLQLVNDTFSRKAGDEILLSFARLLEDGLPKTAVLSRLTGDDFCMLLTHADTEMAFRYANEIRKNVSVLRYLEGDRSLQVTMSIGIATFDRQTGEGNALTTARMACESAKEHGRDRIEVYDEGNRSVVQRYDDMQLVAAIQQALDGSEFELLAQPITPLDEDSRERRYELLLRMEDGNGGIVPTDALFSAAERYWMMPQIDRWVVAKTIAELSGARELVASQNGRFAINLSGQSLGDDDMLKYIENQIDQSDICDSMLCFEITESSAVSNLSNAQKFIDRLRERGCHISLDDFGAGLSSFAYLKNFNVDTLKIDGGFIRDITENRISESMVAAITQVAKVMNLSTVAEYVETESAWQLVKDLGVDYAQGHYISEPLPLRAVFQELEESAS